MGDKKRKVHYEKTTWGVMGQYADRMFWKIGYGERNKKKIKGVMHYWYTKEEGEPKTIVFRDGEPPTIKAVDENKNLVPLTWEEAWAVARFVKEEEARKDGRY